MFQVCTAFCTPSQYLAMRGGSAGHGGVVLGYELVLCIFAEIQQGMMITLGFLGNVPTSTMRVRVVPFVPGKMP